MASHSPNLECRMYEAKYPEVDMAVMIQVKNIADMGAYVSLLEYNNIEGMILFSELSRRRIRSVSSLIKVGRIEPVMVLRVDKEKGYIDLSKRRVSEEDIQACEERYNKSKLVHSIMRHVAETLSVDLEDLYIHIGWPLYRKYGHAFEAFKIIVTDPDSVLNSLIREVKETGPDGQEHFILHCIPFTPSQAILPPAIIWFLLQFSQCFVNCLDLVKVSKVVPAVTEELKDALVKNIRRRMTPQPLKIRADIEMKCFQFDGVLHIKDAMRKAEAAGNNDCPVKIKLVAPPLYVLTTQTLDKDQGISVLTKAIAACTEAIEKQKGKLIVKEEPRAVSERDDKLLAEHMAKLHQQNEEVSGDEDSEEEEEDTGMGEVDLENSGPGITE
ncbi:eukaryotic translation initiation factor 2 subunit alpha homolog isoform X1 [Mangifera indica]|uniref:eukaryotic translation initiation factor 2 subunit alpha homolog isoform X1 n=1 Tax=Mangifera indica TaxID=29780 RepID=UPI001CF9C181|nr:eukaryotic translation initiation factor 2 subunit alpha homolog isoform X1 [Mangifera indica]